MGTRLPPTGMPILSGPPPVIESSNCRQCAKQFNPLWRRAHTCGHCGYEYCSNCLSDGQALMPRRGTSQSSSNELDELRSAASNIAGDIRAAVGLEETAIEGAARGNGYDVESVCLPCLGMLQVTAAPLPILRALPIKRLKDYLAAYDIPCVGPKEKEDFVQAVVRARNPKTGCLAPEAESYYRRRSVPKHGESTKPKVSTPTSSAPNGRTAPSPSSSRPAPAAGPSARTSSSSTTRTQPNTPARPPQPQTQYRPPPTRQTPPTQRPSPSYTQARPPAQPSQSQPQTRPTPPKPTPPPPIPTILSLVSLPQSYLSSLSIGTLKAILFENHVRVDFKQVREKNELIARVNELVSDERKRLERQRIEEERENSALETPAPNGEAAADEIANGTPPNGEGISTDLKGNVPTGPMPEVDRGLCVVCQDEEATLAVVDCGHLCMCAHCSDLIMATSQECPLCRTRIVTKQRLIRIYRV